MSERRIVAMYNTDNVASCQDCASEVVLVDNGDQTMSVLVKHSPGCLVWPDLDTVEVAATMLPADPDTTTEGGTP